MYTSPLFRKSILVAEQSSEKTYIVSAKYGLLEPTQTIDPYDTKLGEMHIEARWNWGRKVVREFTRRHGQSCVIDVFAGSEYAAILTPLLEAEGHVVTLPLGRLSIGRRLSYLNEVLNEPEEALYRRFYRLVEKLESGGAAAQFECLRPSSVPNQGLYLFFEPTEVCQGSSRLRVVRIGTHAVSKGSKSTLWSRLKTHLGTSDGGSHRSSIFRLHVGAALRARRQETQPPSWGLGMTASPETREAEKGLEAEVTRFMRSLRVAWLDIGDPASSVSDRAILECQLIGFLSNQLNPHDPPSSGWLGLHSPTTEIVRSGLWNIRSTSTVALTGFLDLFEFYVEVTLGQRPKPLCSVSERFIASRDTQMQLDVGMPDGDTG